MSSPPKPSPAVITELDMERLMAALEDERRRRKLTHRGIAGQLDVSASTMAYWRLGTTRPTGDALLRIIVWLGLDRDLRRFIRKVPTADPLPAATTEAA